MEKEGLDGIGYTVLDAANTILNDVQTIKEEKEWFVRFPGIPRSVCYTHTHMTRNACNHNWKHERRL